MAKERKVEKPTEGVEFWVNPKEINQARFALKRRNKFEEEVRQMIIASFKAGEENPALMEHFDTFIPKRTWDDHEGKTGQELLNFTIETIKVGRSSITNCIEQGFEWAQRIENGESWKEVCSEILDFASYILILWEDGTLRYLGSSYSDRSKGDICTRPTYIDEVELVDSETICIKTVPKMTFR